MKRLFNKLIPFGMVFLLLLTITANAQSSVTLTFNEDFSEGDTYSWDVSIDDGYDTGDSEIEDGDTITVEILEDSPTVEGQAVQGSIFPGNYSEVFEVTKNDGEETDYSAFTLVIPVKISNDNTVKDFLSGFTDSVEESDGEFVGEVEGDDGTTSTFTWDQETGLLQSQVSEDSDGNTAELELQGGGIFGLPVSPVPVVMAFAIMVLAVPILRKSRQ